MPPPHSSQGRRTFCVQTSSKSFQITRQSRQRCAPKLPPRVNSRWQWLCTEERKQTGEWERQQLNWGAQLTRLLANASTSRKKDEEKQWLLGLHSHSLDTITIISRWSRWLSSSSGHWWSASSATVAQAVGRKQTERRWMCKWSQQEEVRCPSSSVSIKIIEKTSCWWRPPPPLFATRLFNWFSPLQFPSQHSNCRLISPQKHRLPFTAWVAEKQQQRRQQHQVALWYLNRWIVYE